MARITVEDCIDKVPNRFDLVLLAAHRAREISLGAELTVDRDKDKNPVVALREIADETLTADQIRESAIESRQLQIEVDEPEEDQDRELAITGASSKFLPQLASVLVLFGLWFSALAFKVPN